MAHCYKSAIRPDIIAHSAASQRGREGRRKRWGKVCVTIKNLLYFLQEAYHQYFQICYTYSQILCFLISWLGKEAYGYSNEGRFNSAGIWTVFCSRHHKGNEKAYGIEGTYILPVTETGQGSQRSCGRTTGNYDSRQTELIVLLAHLCEE